MKIIYCLPSLYISGGRERVIVNKVNWLANRGYDITIITTDQGEKKPFYTIDPKVTIKDLSINYNKQSKRSVWLKLLHFIINRHKHYWRLRSFLHQVDADIIVSSFSNEMSYLHKCGVKSKTILELHTQKSYITKNLGKSLLDRIRKYEILHQIKNFDAFVVLTNTDSKDWGGARTIPNALSFTPRERSSLKEKRVLAVGRLCYIKGYERLINIWRDFHPKNPEWILEIVGDGELQEVLQRLINEYNLQECIRIKHATTLIQQEYLKSSILCLTSIMESFGMVLIEAQSCGVPVIAYDVPCGPAEIIHNGEDGFLIKDGDINEYVAKLSLLATNEELRQKMGDAAYLNAQRYSEDAIMVQWENLFHELTGK